MTKEQLRILVPRILDTSNFNAQSLNAKAMLSHFTANNCKWVGTYYSDPELTVQANSRVELVKLWRWRFWSWRMFLLYQQSADAIFYPGIESIDYNGLKWRRRLGLSAPVITTFEGLVGDEVREKEYSNWAGHPVFCQHVPQSVVKRVDDILNYADHIIAISPFLAKMGKQRYGDKFSVLPLGIDTSAFYPPVKRDENEIVVISVGRLAAHKRPEVFFDLAKKYPEVKFKWIGDGELRQALILGAAEQKLSNLYFTGSLSPEQLADEFRKAHILVIPSKAEGVPKVTQEAAACGLPIVLFGYYEAPTVENGLNGFVVWSDQEMFDRVGVLISDRNRRLEMGKQGAILSEKLDWRNIAPKWEKKILELVS